MLLTLSRPLVFLDFETTGLDTQNDRIVELAFVKMHPDGTREPLVQRGAGKAYFVSEGVDGPGVIRPLVH